MKVEKLLEDSHKFYFGIIERFSIPAFVINKDHKVTHWNAVLESLSGIRKDEIIGTDEQWRAFWTEKRPVLADLIIDGASAAKISEFYQGKCSKSLLIDGAYEAEDSFPALDKIGRCLHFTASPIRDENGEVIVAVETLAGHHGAKAGGEGDMEGYEAI